MAKQRADESKTHIDVKKPTSILEDPMSHVSAAVAKDAAAKVDVQAA